MIGFTKLSTGVIRIRVYDEGAVVGGPAFLRQANVSVADWNTILAAIGTGTGGAQTPAAGAENLTITYDKQAGKLGPNE